MRAVTILDHREFETAATIVALQKPAYAVEAAHIGYYQMPGLIESPTDVAALSLTMLGAFDHGELSEPSYRALYRSRIPTRSRRDAGRHQHRPPEQDI